jgi:hypothetical protein
VFEAQVVLFADAEADEIEMDQVEVDGEGDNKWNYMHKAFCKHPTLCRYIDCYQKATPAPASIHN